VVPQVPPGAPRIIIRLVTVLNKSRFLSDESVMILPYFLVFHLVVTQKLKTNPLIAKIQEYTNKIY